MATDERFPSASIKSQRKKSAQNESEEKNIPVISGDGVKRKEKSKTNLLADDFRDVKNYVLTDVIIPAAKNTLVDMVSKGINMLVYGEDRSPNRHSGGSRFNYNSISSSNRDDRDRPRARRSSYDYDDLLFDTRGDAERVFEEMCDVLESTGSVSIGDMYDFANQQTLQTDFDWGWTNLRDASVERNRNGDFYIYLPRPVALSRR